MSESPDCNVDHSDHAKPFCSHNCYFHMFISLLHTMCGAAATQGCIALRSIKMPQLNKNKCTNTFTTFQGRLLDLIPACCHQQLPHPLGL